MTNKLLPAKIILVLIILLSLGTVMGVIGYLVMSKPAKIEAPKATEQPNLDLRDVKIVTANTAGIDRERIFFSSDGQKIVWLDYRKTGKVSVFLNGKKEGEYDEVSNPFFSPDGKQFVYSVLENRRKSQFIIAGGNKQEMDSSIKQIVFSPDSKQVVYIKYIKDNVLEKTAQLDKQTIIINGQETGIVYDYIWGFTFSPDSKHSAYVASKEEKEFIVIDGKEQQLMYDEIYHPVFTPDYKQVAYSAKNKGTWILVVNDKEITNYDDISDYAFSPDGNNFAFAGQKNEKWFIILNGKEQEMSYDWVGNIAFNPFNGQVVYGVEVNPEEPELHGPPPVGFFVINGKEEVNSYSFGIKNFIFSPDGKHYAYIGDGQQVVLDGKEYKKYDWVWNLAFSSDGKYLTYNSELGDEFWRRVDRVDIN